MKPPEPPIEEVVASALNEQGYLLQNKLAGVLHSKKPDGSYPHNWYIEAEEVPVSLPNGDETRVDLVLHHEKRKLWRAVMETKRASRDYKKWIFFGQTERHPGPSSRKYYLEYADMTGGWHVGSESDPPMIHGVKEQSAYPDCPVFDFGLEARIKGPNEAANSGTKASATTTIEDALRQVTLGQAGISARLRQTRELQFRIVPIIVTTAELYSAHFGHTDVSLATGMVAAADLTIKPQRWLAINHRVSDVICRQSRFTGNISSDIGAHVVLWQTRTVFIVNTTGIQEFLGWLGDCVSDWG